MATKKIALVVSVLVLGMALGACHRIDEPNYEPMPDGEGAVAFQAQIGAIEEPHASRSSAPGAVSKATQPEVSKTAFVATDQMGLFLSLNASPVAMVGNTHGKYTYDNLLYTHDGQKFSTAVGSPAGTIYYPYRTTAVDLWGVYPYDAHTANYSASAYPWSVAADQTAAAAVVGSDLLLGVARKVVPNNTGLTVDLNFKHRMTLLRIAIGFPEEIDGKKLNPTTPIAAIYMDNIKTKAAVDWNKETVAPAAGATDQTMKPHALGFTVPAPADGRAMDSMFYQAIVVPQTIENGTKQLIRIEVNYDNGTQGLFLMPVDADITFESGTVHTFSISFDTKNRLRLEASKKVAWDKDATFNTSNEVWQGNNQTIAIGSTTWARGFLVADGTNKGCKIGTTLDAGLFFQFGSLVGWDQSKNALVKPNSVAAPAWNSNYYTAGTSGELFNVLPTDNPSGNGTGDACRFYLGSAWRLPTSAELFALTGQSAPGSYVYASANTTGSFDNTTFAGKAGAWLGPMFAARDTMSTSYFYQAGSLATAGTFTAGTGVVGSASLGATVTVAQSLSFTSTQLILSATADRKQGALARCVWVRKIYLFDNPAMSGTKPATMRIGFNFPCAWTVAGMPAWLTLAPAAGSAVVGEATKTITMTPSAATTTARTATLTITATDSATGTVATQTVVVTQNP